MEPIEVATDRLRACADRLSGTARLIVATAGGSPPLTVAAPGGAVGRASEGAGSVSGAVGRAWERAGRATEAVGRASGVARWAPDGGGWASDAAVAGLAGAVRAALDRCGARVGATATGLRRAATAYDAVDDSAARRVGRWR